VHRTATEIGYKKCIRDDTKAAARQSPNCIKKQKKILRKTIFNMADAMCYDDDIDFAR